MLTGKELGAAIESARKLKGLTKKAMADAFSVKPPSIQDWVNRGTIDKEKLPRLWELFSDVVGPTHWGLQEFPWASDAVSLSEGATPIQTLGAPKALTQEFGQAVSRRAILLLADRLRLHSHTRRTIIGGVLLQLAKNPDDVEVVDEISALIGTANASKQGRLTPSSPVIQFPRVRKQRTSALTGVVCDVRPFGPRN